jgi:hypothetical protein
MISRFVRLGVVTACTGLALAGAWGVPAVAGAAAPAATGAGCTAPAAGQVGCAALVTPGVTAKKASALAAGTAPPGYGPLDLRHAYGLDFSALTGGVGQTVAVVTAYDDATAETDMGTYRSQYNLPACTIADGCFSKVAADGGTDYPPPGPAGWSLATAEGLDMISAICPNCHILLVEADSTNFSTVGSTTGLGQAEDEAVTLGADFIANTFFTPEVQGETANDSYFDHPGVAITAPDGNGGGYGVSYPAASPYVIAVGGTTLTPDHAAARGWTETAWSGTGSGCSAYEPKPSWQTDTGCTTRMLNDVSAVADPVNSPVAFYDATSGGWVTGGGDNVAAAIVAGAWALAGTPAAGSYPASYLYAHAQGLNDVTTGSDGTCAPSPAYFCAAGAGYDGPTGLGTPATAAAFGATAPDASLPGAPAAYDPLTGNQEVYVTGAGVGTAFQDAWSPVSGDWSGWQNLSGTTSERPAATFNPASGNFEVYARGINGYVVEDYWTGSAWSDWKHIDSGQIQGSPSAVFDPLDDALQVFVTYTTGVVYEDSWTAAAGWSGWQSLGGTVSGGPAAIYNPASGNLEVYARGINGYVVEDYWTGSAWSGWKHIDSGQIEDTPSVVYNPLDDALQVFVTGTTGTAFEDSWTSAGWSGWQNLGGVLSGSPSVVYDPLTGALEAYGTGNPTAGTVWGDSWTTAGWTGWKNLSGDLSGSPDAVYGPASHSLQVLGFGTDKDIFVNTRTSTGWSGWTNLGGTFGDL